MAAFGGKMGVFYAKKLEIVEHIQKQTANAAETVQNKQKSYFLALSRRDC